MGIENKSASVSDSLKLNETICQLLSVNKLLQGICARVDRHELTQVEAEGIYIVLEWQNEKLAAIHGGK